MSQETMSQLFKDPANYRAMLEPHGSVDEANAAASAFFDGVMELRKKFRLPNVLASLALAFAEATGDVTEPAKALVDAAMVDIPALGWDAPFTLLSLVERLRTAREAAGGMELHIDADSNGPWCKHGVIPEICSTCGLPAEIEARLRTKLVELARAD